MAKKDMTLEEKLNEAIVKDGPYEVPGNWVWSNVGSISIEIKNGTTIKQNKDEDGIKVTRIESLQNNSIDLNRLGTIVEIEKLKEKDYYEDGDIALSHINSLEHVGKTALIDKSLLPLVHGMNLLRVRVNKDLINPKFFQFYTRGYDYKDEVVERVNRAVNQVSLNQKNLSDLPFPIPPFKEQDRIVNRIESLFEKLDKAKELIEDAREGFGKRKDAMLEQAFSGKLTEKWRDLNLEKKVHILKLIKKQRLELCKNESDIRKIEEEFNYVNCDSKIEGWINIRAKLICDNITKGETPSQFISKHGDVPFLKVYNIRDNKLDFEYDKSFIPHEVHESKMKRSKVYPNDVIMNIVGPPLQKIAIITEEYAEWNINQAIAIFRPINSVLSKYLYYCLLYKETLKDILTEVRGVVGQSNISLEQCRDIKIPLPCKEEQNEIVRILDKLFDEESKIDELTQLEEQIDLIKKSILAKAFRGELGTNCGEDESALKLLKEILSEN